MDNKFNDHPEHESRRIWGSNGAALGLDPEVDNQAILFGDIPFNVQSKWRKKLASYMTPPEDVDATIIQESHGKPLVVMDLDKFFDLLDTVQGVGKQS